MSRQIRMNPRVAKGQPCLEGTHIPVSVFLELFKRGYSIERIVSECYPELSREDVVEAIDFMIDWVRRAPMYLPDLVDQKSSESSSIIQLDGLKEQ
ncbi:DUF433 domain-containing protein [Leptospirillum ferriphilum]|jgi:uncharacterized protein (DUF433 family)|uniref:DUF433 domain-containing protein n=2 Tax=Leptospirillum TaxID=179 RepID=A0A094W7M7_9BACT|nr:DUF433 domain-containing protein [Leptospirillum ferriphilum]EDZ38957.1 MAG: Protein of unknown function [Leptospirillum sp. Group II '5-way CG']KGA93483.1 hypothetical protein LptCag_0096 [Leptospirillum ferriphilum]